MDICIDFDGTCVTHEFPRVGRDIGAAPVLRKLVENGHRLILFTMRGNRPVASDTGDPTIMDVTGMFLDDAVEWFNDMGIPLYGINVNPTQDKWTNSPKAYGQLYIDDAALGCPLIYAEDMGVPPYVDWVAVEKMLIGMGILK